MNPIEGENLREMSRQLFVDFQQMAAFSEDPLVLVEGRGIRVRDAHGRWYIDGLAGVFTSSLGHGNEHLVAAAAEQAATLAFGMPLYATNLPSLRFADRLLELVGPSYGAIKQTGTGSEATESAMKLARQFHIESGRARKFKVLSHYRSYHGATGQALAASGGAGWRATFEPFAGGFVHVHAPFAIDRRMGWTLGDEAAVDAALALLAETIEIEDPDTISAFITEPIMLSAGVRVLPDRYLQGVAELCERHGIVLIFDEIITGAGRTGRLFAAEHAGVQPDITCFAKGFGGGYAALAGIIVKSHLVDVFAGDSAPEFKDGHTFGNHPVAAAVGLAALQDIVPGGAMANAARQGDRLAAAFRDAGLASIREVRGRGLLVGIDLTGPGAPTGPAVAAAARRRGLIGRVGADFLAFGPPLITTDAETDEIAAIALESIRAAAAGAE